MSSTDNEEEPETLGLFFDTHYSQLLKFLPNKDVVTMSILNQKWNQRVESHKIWMSLIGAMQSKNPAKKEIKKIIDAPAKSSVKASVITTKEVITKLEKSKPQQPVVNKDKFSECTYKLHLV